MNVFIGIDNGVSGAIGTIKPAVADITHTPVRKELNYTKEKAWINRLDVEKFEAVLIQSCIVDTDKGFNPTDVLVGLERPMVNPMRFKATISAIRCLEASLIVIERLKLPYEYIDSKQWQKELLPGGLKGDELKTASLEIGKRKFPSLATKFKKDADSILMALYLKQRETRTL